MKNLIELRYSFELLFFEYLKGVRNIESLRVGMARKQAEYKNKHRKEGKLWFKFAKDDTGATTIKELTSDLINQVNKTFREEQMKACVDLNASINGTELQIYFTEYEKDI